MDVNLTIPDDLAARITEAWHRIPTETEGTSACWTQTQQRHLDLVGALGALGSLPLPDVLAVVVRDALVGHRALAAEAARHVWGTPSPTTGPLPSGVTS
jgi:hypothetical protein